jgi:hypothetical protein
MKAYTLNGKSILAIVTLKEKVWITGLIYLPLKKIVDQGYTHFEKYIFDKGTDTVQLVGSYHTVYQGNVLPGQAHIWVRYEFSLKGEKEVPTSYWVENNPND